MPNLAQPVTAGQRLTDAKTPTGLTQSGIQHFKQWQQAINSIPISVSGEQVKGAGTKWTLANTPAGNVALVGFLAGGPLPLAKGAGNLWNFTIDGQQITTAQAYDALIASYEYIQ